MENNAKSEVYEIVVRGHLAPRCAGWFEGMVLTPRADGTTMLKGRVADQAALHGLLNRIRDLALVLLSVNFLEETKGEDE